MAKVRIKCEDPVVVTCYGQTKVWERKDALDFFLEGARFCDGSEAERYFNIYYQLLKGAKEAYDQ
jgi:hypothetical protein